MAKKGEPPPPRSGRRGRRSDAELSSAAAAEATPDSGQTIGSTRKIDTIRTVTVTNTGVATATNGGIANSGFIESLTVVRSPPQVPWPISIGRVPPLASAFQPRASAHRVIGTDRDKSAGAVLTSSESISPQEVLAGGGGVGKTQLAAWYADQAIRGGADLVIWVDASIAGAIPSTFARAGRQLRVPGVIGHENPIDEDAAAFLDWLQSTRRRWLIVLDDVVHPPQAAEWWPVSRTGTGWTLATTRRRDEVLFAAGRRRIDVDVYAPQEALNYLNQRISGAGKAHLLDEGASELARELGYLPLALSHAAAYILSQQTPTSTYLSLFRAEGVHLDQLMGGDPDNWASTTITITLLLALSAENGVERSGSPLRRAAMFASALSPVGHPSALWETQAAEAFIKGDASPRQELLTLDRYSLLTIDSRSAVPTARMHALTARAVRERYAGPEASEAAKAAALAVLELWPDNEHEHPLMATLLRGNATAVAEVDRALGNPLWAGRDPGLPLSRRVIRSWIEFGQYREAVGHAKSAISAAESMFGKKHEVVAVASVTLVDAYRAAGELDAAISLGQRAVAALHELLGAHDVHTLEGQNALAVAYRQAGKRHLALELAAAVFHGRRKVLGPDDPDTLESQNNVAVAYWDAGRLGEAIELHEQVLDRRSRVLSNDHPSTLESRNNLAVAYWQDGRYLEAVSLGQEVVDDRLRLLGAGHPKTLESQHNLSSFYRDAGMNAEAVVLGEIALAGHVDVLGPDNHRTLNSRHVLSVGYLMAGRVADAIAEEERAVADCLRVLGADHRYTLAARANLAACYAQAGRANEAVELAEHVVADHTKSLGAGHPNTLRAQIVLATCYRRAGRLDMAHSLSERTVADCERFLRTGHPHTVAALSELSEAREAHRQRGGDPHRDPS